MDGLYIYYLFAIFFVSTTFFFIMSSIISYFKQNKKDKTLNSVEKEHFKVIDIDIQALTKEEVLKITSKNYKTKNIQSITISPKK